MMVDCRHGQCFLQWLNDGSNGVKSFVLCIKGFDKVISFPVISLLGEILQSLAILSHFCGILAKISLL